MNINAERLKNNIEKIANLSKDETGGFTRLAFSDKDKEARLIVKKMMENAGLIVKEDAIGNIIGNMTYDCSNEGFIATGSHIDTVKNGGKFDGLLGSMAAIEVAQTIKEQNIKLKHPLEIIIFSDEEGARFNSGMIGSKSIAGVSMEAALSTYVDKEGISLSDALKDMGINPDKILDAKANPGRYKSFVELHIEQSIVLEQKQKQIGIVNGIKGPYWIKGCFEGESNHAGGTPMNIRKDPLVAAAQFIAETNRIANELGDMFVATVGYLNVLPGGINTIPSKVEFTVDIRDVDMDRRARGVKLIEEAAQKSAQNQNVTISIECIKNSDSEKMNENLMNLIEDICKKDSIKYEILPSGPFHDALTMSTICDVAMIFVPSINGVSHSPFEDTKWEDIYVGAEVLFKTILELVK